MCCIVLDLEWNQPFSMRSMITTPVRLHGEIIQIGAVKLNEQLEIVDTFNDNPPCQMAMLKLGIVPMPLQSVRVNVTLCLTMMEFTDRSLVMLWPFRQSTTPSAGFHASFSVSVTSPVR